MGCGGGFGGAFSVSKKTGRLDGSSASLGDGYCTHFPGPGRGKFPVPALAVPSWCFFIVLAFCLFWTCRDAQVLEGAWISCVGGRRELPQAPAGCSGQQSILKSGVGHFPVAGEPFDHMASKEISEPQVLDFLFQAAGSSTSLPIKVGAPVCTSRTLANSPALAGTGLASRAPHCMQAASSYLLLSAGRAK